VNAFTIAGGALLAGVVPLLVVVLRASILSAIVALELAGTVVALALLCFCEGFHSSSSFDVPVIAVVSTWVGSLGIVRVIGKVPR
jgi:hypothetical protein